MSTAVGTKPKKKRKQYPSRKTRLVRLNADLAVALSDLATRTGTTTAKAADPILRGPILAAASR